MLESGNGITTPGKLSQEQIEFIFESEDEVLVEPIFGCWEGNMNHAITRDPIDVCIQRNESRIVLGNAGVVRIIEKGSNVSNCEVGDLCIIFCNAISDRYGYPIKIYAYDCPDTIGILAKKTKLHKSNVIPIPKRSSFSLEQWAAFSLRFITAWANWKIALKCWRSQMENVPAEEEYVVAWGGGVSFAEIMLAKHVGFNVAMITSKGIRADHFAKNGIIPINRLLFPHLDYNHQKFLNDKLYCENYKSSEKIFLSTLDAVTNRKGVAIFIDNIGLSVYRSTLRAIARQGVVTTSGWKWGMELTHLRAIESINRHIHVHTHYANYQEALEAMDYAEKNNWMPDVKDEKIHLWSEIPQLSEEYSEGQTASIYPLFQVNPIS